MAAKQLFLRLKPLIHARQFSAQTRLAIIDTNHSELKNGIRVATEDIGGPTATIGLFLDVGSRYETNDQNGVTNLWTHALLGDPKVEREVQRMGAELRALVGRDRTSLTLRCATKDVEKAIALLGQLVAEPNVESAKKTVLREFLESDANNETVVMNGLHAMAYQNTPLALPPIGKSESLAALSKQQLTDFVNTHVKGPRIVFSAAGSVDHKQIVEAVDKNFGKISSSLSGEAETAVRCRYTGSDLRIRDDAMPLAHIALAVEGPGFNHPDHLALTLASSLVGSWDRTHGGGTDCSSYLGVCGATDNVVQSFRSFNLNYAETGLFGIYMAVERMKQEDAVWHLTYEWKRFCTELTDNELNRAKNLVMTQLMRANEGSAQVANQIGHQFLSFGRRLPLDELQSRILSINAGKVREVCNEYIWDRCPVVSAIGPIEQLEDYEILRGQFYWFRY